MSRKQDGHLRCRSDKNHISGIDQLASVYTNTRCSCTTQPFVVPDVHCALTNVTFVSNYKYNSRPTMEACLLEAPSYYINFTTNFEEVVTKKKRKKGSIFGFSGSPSRVNFFPPTSRSYIFKSAVGSTKKKAGGRHNINISSS